jgi:glycosyltransferase involved in cell wall biosynthesis
VIVALFWGIAGLASYSYLLYPLVLAAACRPRAAAPVPHEVSNASAPPLSLIITAYNEAAGIRSKIENTLALDYSPGGLQVIVASDCATDGTDDVVREYSARGVVLVRSEARLGKENAQYTALQAATGDIVVFSDVGTRIPPDALLKLARYFEDPTVGAVSSEDRFMSADGTVSGEGAYVRYEMWLRQMESNLSGLVGLSGSFFAARRSVCAQWDLHSPSDFNTALNCARLRLRAVTAPDVLGFYSDLKDQQKEYRRKVRTVVRGMTAIARHPDVLNVLRFRLFAFQVWSHKLMRWLVPWLLLLLFGINLWLLDRPLYQACVAVQAILYGVAVAARLSGRVRRHQLARLAYFFVQANLATAEASCRFAVGQRMTTWQPSTR